MTDNWSLQSGEVKSTGVHLNLTLYPVLSRHLTHVNLPELTLYLQSSILKSFRLILLNNLTGDMQMQTRCRWS